MDLSTLDTNYTRPKHMNVRVLASSGDDNVRNIAVVLKEHFPTHKQQVFSDLFLRRLAPFSDIRFTEWMEIDYSNERAWIDRPTPMHRRQTEDGVALEHIINLCNQTQSTCWVNVPHLATEEYVTEMATLIRDTLDPGLKVVAEYSNETWSEAFGQTQYLRQHRRRVGRG